MTDAPECPDPGEGGRSVRARMRRAAGTIVAIGAVLVSLGVSPSISSANQGHYFAGVPGSSFGTPGSEAGQLALRPAAVEQHAGSPYVNLAAGGSGLAVDDAAEDVYVADTENHRVSEFDQGGAFVRAWGWGVATGAPELQSCVLACREGLAGTSPGQLEAPLFVAVDNGASSPSRGDVYVADVGDGAITKYDAEGRLQSAWGTGGQMTGFPRLNGIAVGPAGDLWVFAAGLSRLGPAGEALAGPFTTDGGLPGGLAVDGESDVYALTGSEAVRKFDPAGAVLGRVIGSTDEPGRIGSPPPVGLAANQITDELFAAEISSVAAFSEDCLAKAIPCTSFQAFGEGRLDEGAGLAVDSQTGTVYAASAGDEKILAFPPAVEAVTEAASDKTASTATLNGRIDAFGSALTACRFEYGIGSAEGESSVPCAGTPAANGQVAVEAPVSGLEGETTYSFRLSATNANGHVEGEEGSFTTLGSPGIESAEAKEVSGGSALLTAAIDPRGSETHYHFEWGPCEGSCLTSPYPETVPVPDGNVLPGTPVEQAISGLQPGTTYHFRVFADNHCNTAEPAERCSATSFEHTFVYLPSAPIEPGCGNEELRQSNGSSALPDCRAYELVTPARKNGSLIGGIFLGVHEPQIAADGSRIAAPALQCLPGTPSCIGARQSEGEPYEFARGPDGWQANPLAPAAALFRTTTWLSFGADPGTLLFSSPDSVGTEDLWARGEDGALGAIGPIGEPGTSNSILSPAGAVSTSDLSHVVYETLRPVWPFDEGHSRQTPSLYEYAPASGTEPQLVGVTGGFEEGRNHNLISVCGIGLGSGNPTAFGSAYNALSEDGRTVWFTAGIPAESCEPHGSGTNAGKRVPTATLYERIDGSRTVEASAAVPATCTSAECEASPPSQAVFEGASRSGERVLFTSIRQLTDGASQDGHGADRTGPCVRAVSGASGCNLYLSECPEHCEDPSTRRLIDVSEGAKAEGGPKVLGIVAISADAGRVYFVAKGALTTAQNAQGEAAVTGAPNLYLYERGGAHPQGRLDFVAKLSTRDQPNWLSGYGGPVAGASGQGLGVANVTPDGRYLVFESHRALTPGAAAGPAQIYRYDASAEEMTRVSIGQAGFGDDGNGGQAGADASIVRAHGAFVLGNGPARANPTMSGDGRFVFFQSPLALTPGALEEALVEETNVGTKVYAQNVYEWEVDGAGGCREAGGCVSLLSNGSERVGGTTVATPELLGTDETGDNVFLAAADPLTWQDTDTQRDYYDLRAGGGFAPPAQAQACSGDGCRGAGTSAGPGTSPATTSVNGPEEGPKHPRKSKPKTCKKKKGRQPVSCHKKMHHKKKIHGKRHRRQTPAKD